MRKHITLALFLLALAAWTVPAGATNLVANGSFEIATATTTTQFLSAGVANWTNSNIGDALVFPSWFTNGYLFPGVGFAGPVPQTSPDGGNFVFSDSDYYDSPIQQTITGLVPGYTYTLSFYQALAQDTEPNVTVPGPVNALWQVTLGSSTQNTPMMYGDGSTNTISPWALQVMSFTPTSATEALSFFAIGSGDPPLALLDGVKLEVTTPEPASIWLATISTLILGWKFISRRRALAAQRVASK